jgi:formylglycine-generating enzyme required for sulfatase activity
LSACTHTPKDIDWVFVEGGTFEQGKHQIIISVSGDTVRGFTSPNRIVVLDDFYISKYEITVQQFRAFCNSTGRVMPQPPVDNAYGQEVYFQWDDNMPMLATWDEANAFAAWAGGRLPTEAEWEYAAKSGRLSKGYTYSGSNNPIDIGWVFENADSTFHEVGLLQPNELGLYDMTGNVSEWVYDWYNPAMDSLVPLTNPQGPTAGVHKISKGLSWFYETQGLDGNPLPFGIHMPEVRYQSPPDTRNDGFGFRIAKHL